MKDYRAKGAEDFAAKRKDERLFHNIENPGRLYREGWHAARRAAESDIVRTEGFQHAGGPNPAGEPEKLTTFSPGPEPGTLTIAIVDRASLEPLNATPAEVADAINEFDEKTKTGQLDLF